MFDKTRPYGEISGFFHGARYEQDNKYFDAAGDRILIPGEVKEELKSEEVATEKQESNVEVKHRKRRGFNVED